MAAFINSTLDSAVTGYNNAGHQYVDATSGSLALSGVAKGSTLGSVAVGNGAAALTLGLNTTGAMSTVHGPDETVGQVVAYLNTAAQKAIGSDTSAQIFSVSPTGT